jgi:hypothetical protein
MHWILTIFVAFTGHQSIDHQEYFAEEQCQSAAQVINQQYRAALNPNALLITGTVKDESHR